MKQRILYIEDEVFLARIVTETLESKGFEVLHKKDGSRILDHISAFVPDLCVLDVMLPYIDGFSLGKTVRTVYADLPIIFLTAKSQTQDVIEGFASGGTDYLKKPFSMEELIARIENQIKLKGNNKAISLEDNSDIKIGMLTFLPSKYELHTLDEVIKLSNREVEILKIFCEHQNQTIDRKKLLMLVWGDDSYFNSRNLDVYIKKIRDYFISSPGLEIITLKGKGYHFSVS